jgi:murein DD-endopeptidase MepM/ murein hydrolase activator NlpD
VCVKTRSKSQSVTRRHGGLLAGLVIPGLTIVCLAVAAIVVSSPASAGVLSFTWMWPVDAPHRVIREFMAPESEYGSGHRGIDIAVAPGTSVRAPAAGRVLFSGSVAGRGVLTIEHPNDVVSTIEPIEASVRVGDVVVAGDVVGVVAPPDVVWDASHVCSCVHLGARYRGSYVSPRTLLGQARTAVLKPWGDGPATTRAGGLARRSP